MLLNIAFLDDATRPPAPRLEGLTAAQRRPGEHLRMIHDHLRDNMKTLGKLIERARTGSVTPAEIAAETADLAMVANFRRFGNLCGQYCQIVHTHHSIEDYAIFPALAEQGPVFKAIADRLKAEHVVVHELLHLLERAHNERFRTLLDQHLPAWRRWRDELNSGELAAYEEFGAGE